MPYKYGFNGQENSNEVSGRWNHTTAEFWEYDTRVGRRWNLDPRPTVGISEYSVLGNNPIWFSDPLGDAIRTRSTAEVTHTTLSDKGGTRDLGGNAIDYKDAHLVPAVDNNGKLVGYNVYDYHSKDPKQQRLLLQIEPGDMEEFKRGYNSYIGGARAIYAAGEPSEGMKMALAGVEMQNYKLMWEGIKKENKAAWSDPVYVVSFLTMTANAGLGFVEGPLRYDPRVRRRAVEDPTSHNFPYSFDRYILRTKPLLKNNGYKIYQLEGYMM